MYFEQTLIGDYEYYHQDKNGWKDWCDNHIKQIVLDLSNDLNLILLIIKDILETGFIMKVIQM